MHKLDLGDGDWLVDFREGYWDAQKSFPHTTEVLEACGEALYCGKRKHPKSPKFKVLQITITHKDHEEPESLGFTYKPKKGVNVEWVLKWVGRNGAMGYRLLESKHEAFAMLIVQMNMGSKCIQLAHRFCCEPET
jgi:hypothetical protein